MRKMILAIVGLGVVSVAVLTLREGDSTVEGGNTNVSAAASRLGTERTNIPKHATPVDRSASSVEEARPEVLEISPDASDQFSVKMEETNADLNLSYESQNFVQSIALDIVASPDISDAAYMDKFECSDSGCEIQMKFYDSRAIVGKSSALLNEINERLGSNPDTAHLQFGFTTMAKGQDGIGKLELVMVPRQDNSFVITVVEDLNAHNN